MKKIGLYILGAAALFNLASCTDANEYEMEIPSGNELPTDISNVRALAAPGQIILKWDVPADSNYFYVQTTYTDPSTKKLVNKKASVYSDSLLIDNMLLRYGEIEFTVQTFSKTLTGGAQFKVSQTAERAPIQVTKVNYIENASQLSTNAQESSEGPIANLIDGDAGTYFHSSWSVAIAMPHYIQIKFYEELTDFTLSYTNRNNANGKPSEIVLNGSMDGETFTAFRTLTVDDGLPKDAGAQFSIDITCDPIKFLRLDVTKTFAGDTFFNMAELSISHEIVVDPEAE